VAQIEFAFYPPKSAFICGQISPPFIHVAVRALRGFAVAVREMNKASVKAREKSRAVNRPEKSGQFARQGLKTPENRVVFVHHIYETLAVAGFLVNVISRLQGATATPVAARWRAPVLAPISLGEETGLYSRLEESRTRR
jgi:hypothetical protein